MGDSCAQALPKLSLHGGAPVDVRVYATSGRVRLAGGDTLFLGDTRRGWRIGPREISTPLG